MANERVKSVGGYFMRLLGGVAVIVGLLGLFAVLAQGNLIGVVLSIIFIVGGAILLKRSGDRSGPGRREKRPA
ncbi:hypothetical protein ABZU25_28160 [Micromonospora sp. NPDC005215]|uniref:hypothetical protein n=1 Tax=Micromonospora sp. NPDC005215 TaxID=3157024 RepID=UPI0033B609A2